MKSFITKLSLLSLSCIISTTAIAGGAVGWQKVEVVNQRSCAPDRGLEVTFTTAHLNPDHCLNARTVEVDCGLPTYKQILAMVLTAQAANMEVNAYVSGCDSDKQAKVSSIRLR